MAIEDQRFYDHKGIDLVRVAGAAISNLRQGTRAQGGSTLTQQLARNSFLTPEKTYTRKLKELVLARRLEAEFSKDEILELYLNKVYFGAGLYGRKRRRWATSASRRPTSSLAQAALLAGLVKSPSSYAPTVDLARATARRNVVLMVMRDSGVITRDEHTKAVREQRGARGLAPARRGLRSVLQGSRPPRAGRAVRPASASTKAASWSTRPSISAMQKAAEAEVERSLKEIEARQAARRRKGAPAPPRPAAGRAGRAGSADRRSTGAGGRTRLQRQPVRSGQAGEAPGGLGVQAVRVRGGHRSRLLAGVADHEPRRADQDAAGRVDAGGRTPRVAGHDDADGAAHVEQPRGGAHAGRRRHPVGRVARQAHGRRRRSQRAVAGARGRRRHA